METSNIIDEKMSDMSFSLNFNEIIGKIDEKSEVIKMKQEMQQKDECIQALLKRIELLEKGKISDLGTEKVVNTSNEGQSDSTATDVPS
jgi:hypothetical protein